MKKITIILAGLTFIFVFSCNNTDQNNGEKLNNELKNEISSEQKNTDVQKSTQNTGTKVENAKFLMMTANTAGTSYIFKTVSNSDLQLFPDSDLKGMEFAYSLQPGSTDHNFFENEFEIKYEKRTVETPGGSVERYFLINVKPISDSQKNDNSVLEIEKIKKGDIIEGLKVKNITYIKNDMFNINFEGEIMSGGSFSYNEYEGCIDLEVSEKFKPKTIILVDKQEYPLYNFINFINPKDLEQKIGPESLSSIKSGKSVSIENIKIKNITVGMKIDKGRIGLAFAEIVK